MSRNQEHGAGGQEPALPLYEDIYATGPEARKLRSVGRRRRDAEIKLEQHLQKAQHKLAGPGRPGQPATPPE